MASGKRIYREWSDYERYPDLDTGPDHQSEESSAPPVKKPRPASKFKAGDLAMIMTSNKASKLNGLVVTIRRSTYNTSEETWRYTCESEDFGDNGSTITVVAADLVKPKHRVGDTVTVNIRTHGAQKGIVREVQTEKYKFEYLVDFGEVRVAEKSIVG